MAPILYVAPGSPPARSTLLTAEALGLEYNRKVFNLLTKEHLNPEFIKINPQHTVPTLLDEDGYTLWDSHAINAYLVEKYGKDDSFYPKDLKKRGVVNQRLHFDSGILFILLAKTLRSSAFIGKTDVPFAFVTEANDAYYLLNTFLGNSEFVAGDNVTIADFNIVTSITSLELIFPIDTKKYPNIIVWLQRVKSLPYYKVSELGLDILQDLTKNLVLCSE